MLAAYLIHMVKVQQYGVGGRRQGPFVAGCTLSPWRQERLGFPSTPKGPLNSRSQKPNKKKKERTVSANSTSTESPAYARHNRTPTFESHAGKSEHYTLLVEKGLDIAWGCRGCSPQRELVERLQNKEGISHCDICLEWRLSV